MRFPRASGDRPYAGLLVGLQTVVPPRERGYRHAVKQGRVVQRLKAFEPGHKPGQVNICTPAILKDN